MTHDFRVYFESELGRIRDDYNRLQSTDDQLPSDWPRQRRTKLLVRLVVPLFIFAKTVCLFIADYTYSDPEEQLQRVLEVQEVDYASQLHRTYLFVLNRLILKRSDFGLVKYGAEEKEKILDNFRKIVGALVLLEYPLPVDSLSKLLNIPKKNMRNMFILLRFVLGIPKLDEPTAPVRILHLSFRDFLTDPKNKVKNPFWIDEMDTHAVLSSRCLDLLLEDGVIYKGINEGPNACYDAAEECHPPSATTVKCMQKLGLDTASEETTLETVDSYNIIGKSRLPPYVQYACVGGLCHYNSSSRNDPRIVKVLAFLYRKLNAWLEAIACLDPEGGFQELSLNIDVILQDYGLYRKVMLCKLAMDQTFQVS